jgi:BatD DUF11 like domain
MIIDKIKYYLVVVIFLQSLLYAQTFTASTDKTTVGLNNTFQITFTFEGKDVNGLSNFSPPHFENFLVLSGPNQSTSMQIINGAVSASQGYSFYLQPRNIGTFTVGSASIKYEDKIYKTEPLTFKVIKGSAPNAANQNKSNSKNNSSVSNEEIAKNLFIRATADRYKAYQGEQVTVTYKLYTRVSIASQMSVSKLPQYDGFWAEELETSNNINFTNEVVDGRQFKVGVLKKVALFPTKTGTLSVTPFELTVPIRVRRQRNSNNFFDDFFNDPFDLGQTINYDAKSNTIKVNVVPLPEQSKPANFSGAVGQFTLNSKLDNTKPKTNEPVTLTIDLSGTGNISLIDLPEINLPNGIEQYEPKTTSQINRKNRISGRKTFQYLLVPRTAGEKTIPPVKFSYFDPEKKSYKTISTPSYALNVKQGTGENESSNYVNNSKQDIRQLGTDIRFIKTSYGDLNKKGNPAVLSFGFWAATTLPLIALIGLVGWKRRSDKLAGNVQLLRYTHAEKVAKSRLKTAKSLMGTSNQAAFYTEISQALFGYLEDKLHIPKSEFTLDRAVSELEKRGISSSLIYDMKYNAEKCEFVRFSPGADGNTAMHEMYDDMSKVIIGLERSIGAKKYA